MLPKSSPKHSIRSDHSQNRSFGEAERAFQTYRNLVSDEKKLGTVRKSKTKEEMDSVGG